MISIIFPTYNEEQNLETLAKRLDSALFSIQGYRFQFIFVDDGSTDQTPEILRRWQTRDPRVKVIRLARNFGSHAALAAGLSYCTGDCAIVLAADLQDPPEMIGQLLKAWENKAKIVWAVRTDRRGEKALTKFFSRMYYRLMNWLTTVKMPPLGSDVFLADQIVLKAFRQVTEKHSSVFMTLAWLGFPQATITYVKEARPAGRSKWTLARKLTLTLDSFLAFSDIPIRYMSILGFLTALFGFMYAIYVFGSYLKGLPVQGWSSLIVAILVVGGIQMMMLGILGEYLWRTFDESRKRPRYIVEYTLEEQKSEVNHLSDPLKLVKNP